MGRKEVPVEDQIASARRRAEKQKLSVPVAEEDPWILTEGEIVDNVNEYCRLASIQSGVNPLLEQKKKKVKARLFEMWVHKMWDEQDKPANPTFVVKKSVDGVPTEEDDMKCQLQVKHKSDGLQKSMKEIEKQEGETIQEKIIQVLMKKVRLTEGRATKFVQKEVKIIEELVFPMTLEAMIQANPESETGALWKSIGRKLLGYIEATSTSKSGQTLVECLDEVEKKAIVVTRQEVVLDHGMIERSYKYVQDAEQLQKLLEFCDVTLQIGNVEFGMADTTDERLSRLKGTIDDYFMPKETATVTE